MFKRTVHLKIKRSEGRSDELINATPNPSCYLQGDKRTGIDSKGPEKKKGQRGHDTVLLGVTTGEATSRKKKKSTPSKPRVKKETGVQHLKNGLLPLIQRSFRDGLL